MTRIACLMISLACASVGHSQEKQSSTEPTKPAADKQSHEGVWKPIAAVLGGVRLPDEAVKAITLKVSGDKYEVTIEGTKEADKGTCTLDKTVIPHRMTITSDEGPNRGKTMLAIYEMKDANSMRVCYDLSGKEFPTEFKAPKGTKLYLVGYRRQPPSDDEEKPK